MQVYDMMNNYCRLTQLVENSVKLRQQKRNNWLIHQWRTFKRWQDFDRGHKEYMEEKRRVRNAIPLSEGFYISPERLEDVMPKKELEDMNRKDQGLISMEYLTNLTQMRYVDHSIENLRRCHEYRHFQGLQYDQRFIPERLMFLGADLAAAHFIVHRDGAVKFLGDEIWYKRNAKGRYELPGEKMDGWHLEAIDASGTELMFEGFDNMYDLKHLRMLRLADCKWIDDWSLSRIGGIFSETLEMLDLSNCHRISAKGLFGLRSLSKLRYLRLEGMDKVEGIAKSALMLEDALPNLVILGLDYDGALDALEDERKLLEHERVVIDAKGNAFMEDDNGRLFYVKGNINERPNVCDDDRPLLNSLIRRELPNVPNVEFEELDLLSKGKLRHLLLGSPSGYSWSEQVETILSFDHQWKRWEKVPEQAKMLPRYKRTQLLEEARARIALREKKAKNRLQDEESERNTREKLAESDEKEIELMKISQNR